jgi:ketose-bisphosphate aldolase
MAFTCYSADTADIVLGAAEEVHLPVVLLVSEHSFLEPGGPRLVTALRAIADGAQVPVDVQLDHTTSLSVVKAALAAGVTAVMADGSALPFDQNVELTSAVVTLAHERGAWVEGELGHVPGNEEVADSKAPADEIRTDPARAREFVEKAGANLLAVAIGNVHGRYVTPPVLDWHRLGALNAVAPAPLALHGASGLDPDDVQRSTTLGIRKINVNTELRAAWFEAMAAGLPARADGFAQLELLRDVASAVRVVVSEKLQLIRS